MSNAYTLIAEFHWLRPSGFVLLVPVALIWWFCVCRSNSQRSLESQVAPHLLKHLVVQPETRSHWDPGTVLLGLWLVGTIALAGPSWRQEPSPFATDESNLWIVLKLTPSMESDDVLPSRLERVRNKLHDLMGLRKGSATGLVVYSESSHLVMPPTGDNGVIDEMLQSLDSSVMPGEGDSLTGAITMVAEHIERDSVAASILIVADAADTSQQSALRKWNDAHGIAIQWLVPIATESSLSGLGVAEAAEALDADVVRLSADDADIQQIAGRAKSAMVASITDPSARWRDDGYWLLWPIVIGAALWSRRGWSVAGRAHG